MDGNLILHAGLDNRLRWLNPPEEWSVKNGVLAVRTRAGTDFWQRTHYGFQADNGHFLGLEAEGDFSVTTEVRFHFVHQYDQAGLLIRASPDCWIKASVEHEPAGPAALGAVVTNLGYSDWSLQDFAGNGPLRLRIRHRAGDVSVECALGDSAWKMIRMAHLHRAEAGPLVCGLYACSPKGEGFRAEFAFLHIGRED